MYRNKTNFANFFLYTFRNFLIDFFLIFVQIVNFVLDNTYFHILNNINTPITNFFKNRRLKSIIAKYQIAKKDSRLDFNFLFLPPYILIDFYILHFYILKLVLNIHNFQNLKVSKFCKKHKIGWMIRILNVIHWLSFCQKVSISLVNYCRRNGKKIISKNTANFTVYLIFG